MCRGFKSHPRLFKGDYERAFICQHYYAITGWGCRQLFANRQICFINILVSMSNYKFCCNLSIGEIMKEFCFTFDVTGSCEVIVEADNIEEAVKKIKEGTWKEDVLNEWEIQFPYHDEELPLYWSNKSDFKDE